MCIILLCDHRESQSDACCGVFGARTMGGRKGCAVNWLMAEKTYKLIIQLVFCIQINNRINTHTLMYAIPRSDINQTISIHIRFSPSDRQADGRAGALADK